MRLLVTARIRRACASLTAEDQKQVQRAFRTMAEALRRPGLRVKCIQGTQRFWEAPASRSLRITFETEGDAIVIRNMVRHDEALGRP